MNTLIRSLACQVTHTNTELQIALHRRWFSIVGACLLLLFGVMPVPVGLLLMGLGTLEAGSISISVPEMLAFSLTGLPFVILSGVYLWILFRHWGQITVSTEGVTWRKGKREVGHWPRETIQGTRTGIAVNHSMRFRMQSEKILWMQFSDGKRVRIAIGYNDELDAVRDALKTMGIDP